METMTVGGAMSGNCAIGRVLIPSTPRNKRMIEITIANAGRWRIFVNMVWENLVGSVSRCRSGCYSAWNFLVLEGLFRLDETRIPPFRLPQPPEPLPERSCRSRQVRYR